MPVQFSVVDIFDLLEEQLGEAEDLEMAFPRGGVRARVGANEIPQTRESPPALPPARGGPPPVQNPFRAAPRSPRGGRPGQWQTPDPTLPPTFQCYRCGEFGHRYRDCQNEACTWPAGKGKGKCKGNISPRGKSTAGGGVSQHPPPSTRAIAPPAHSSTAPGGRGLLLL